MTADLALKPEPGQSLVGEEESRMLFIKSFQALRNYDSWFGGASEFFIKCGAVDGFKAATDAELKTYTPSVTDFMVVVKRRQVGKIIPLDALLLTSLAACSPAAGADGVSGPEQPFYSKSGPFPPQWGKRAAFFL